MDYDDSEYIPKVKRALYCRWINWDPVAIYSIYHAVQHENVAIFFYDVALYWQRRFLTLPNLNAHPSVTVYHTLMVSSTTNTKDLMQSEKF